MGAIMRPSVLALSTVAAVGIALLGVPVRSADNKSNDTKPTQGSAITEYNGKTLKQWVEEIDRTKNPDPGLRVRAIQAVTVFDKDMASKEAGPALIKCIEDGDASVRVNCLIALALLGVQDEHAKDAVPALVRRLNEDSQGVVRLHAAVVLGTMDTAARDAIPALINRTKELAGPGASYEIRKAAVTALAQVGQGDKNTPVDFRAVQAIAAVLAGGPGTYPDSSAEVRLAAVAGLAGIGIPASQTEKAVLVNALNTALKDKQKVIQIWARVGLMHVDGITDDHLKQLLPYLKGSDAMAKVEAIKALGAVGPKAAKVCYKDLAELLDEKDLGIVVGSAWALSEWGSAADDALPKLQKLYEAKDTDDRIRPALKEAMERIRGKKP